MSKCSHGKSVRNCIPTIRAVSRILFSTYIHIEQYMYICVRKKEKGSHNPRLQFLGEFFLVIEGPKNRGTTIQEVMKLELPEISE